MLNPNTVELLQNGGYDLSQFTQQQIDFIIGIAKLSYREGLADGEGNVMHNLSEFLRIQKEKQD